VLRCGGSNERLLFEGPGRLLLKFGAVWREDGALKPPCGRAEETPPDCDERAHAGRSLWLMRADCAGTFAGRLELEKPRGDWPRSVLLPWASQDRGLFPVRCGTLLFTLLLGIRVELGIAEGGRFCERSR